MDFLYPSEGVHRRWDAGYRITSTAATWDQTALVLSVPRRKPADETQETLRTSAFPSTHVKVEYLNLLFMHCSLSPLFPPPHTCHNPYARELNLLVACRRSGQKTFTLHLCVMGELFPEASNFVEDFLWIAWN